MYESKIKIEKLTNKYKVTKMENEKIETESHKY